VRALPRAVENNFQVVTPWTHRSLPHRKTQIGSEPSSRYSYRIASSCSRAIVHSRAAVQRARLPNSRHFKNTKTVSAAIRNATAHSRLLEAIAYHSAALVCRLCTAVERVLNLVLNLAHEHASPERSVVVLPLRRPPLSFHPAGTSLACAHGGPPVQRRASRGRTDSCERKGFGVTSVKIGP
jgi:hypothetical protein